MTEHSTWVEGPPCGPSRAGNDNPARGVLPSPKQGARRKGIR